MIRINLIAVEQTPAKAKLSFDLSKQLPALTSLILVAALGGVGWWYWSLTTRSAQLDTDIAAAQIETERLKSVLQQVTDFERRRGQLQQRVALIEELRVGQSGPVHLLDQVSRNLPERLWLTAFKQTGSEIIIDGLTSSLTSLAEFVSSLETSGFFSRPVEIIDSQVEQDKSGADLVTFKVRALFAMPGAAKPTQGD